jgi:phosphate/sulfate permease
MNSKKTGIVIVSFFGAGLFSVYAQALDPDTVLQKIVTEIFSPLYKLTVAIAFVYFLYGVMKYIHDMRNPQEKNTGKQHLLWGMIGLFIIFSVGGILNIFGSIFGNLGFS